MKGNRLRNELTPRDRQGKAVSWTRRATRLGLAAAVCLAAVGCSKNDSNDSAATSSTVAPLRGAPVKVEVIYDASPELVDGARAAAESVNRAGGLRGRPLEVIGCDTKSDPNQAAACGRQAVDGGIVALVGSLTPLAGAYMPILAQNKIASIGNLPVTPDDFSSPASFPLDGGLVTMSAGLGDAMYRQGARKLAVVRADLPIAAAITQFANAGLRRHGTRVVNDVSVPLGAPDMSPYVASATAGGADAVFVGLFGQDATNFVVALRQQRPEVKVGLVTTDLDTVISSLGGQAEGLMFMSTVTLRTAGDPAAKRYLADLKAAGIKNSGGYRENAYAATLAFAKVAEKLPELTPSAVFDAMATTSDLRIGLTPPLQFTKGGVAGLPRVFNPCVVYAQVKGGGQEPIVPGFVDPFTGEQCAT